jgi:hypothetical protein
MSSLFKGRWQRLIAVANQVTELQQEIQEKDQQIANVMAATPTSVRGCSMADSL